MSVSQRVLAAAGACIFLFVAGGVSGAQSFPLQSGQWEADVTVPGQQAPFKQKFCMNDQTWQKALANKICTISNFNVTSSGGTYSMSCSSESFQMKGDITLAFDGKEHMTSKGTMVTTAQGKTTSTASFVDWHWKASACDGTEVNMRDHNSPK